jgi:hypothetical protein
LIFIYIMFRSYQTESSHNPLHLLLRVFAFVCFDSVLQLLTAFVISAVGVGSDFNKRLGQFGANQSNLSD